jgi:geranylgeranyl diphosphate synthase type II
MDLKQYLNDRRKTVNKALEKYLPPSKDKTDGLVEAMRYSLLAGGKRIRPILCMAGARAVGGNETDVLPFACSLEFIHTYSLIHDDLPVMDDDDLRRGKPTNHKIYGEAMALLAGDGLLTAAFNLMTAPELAKKVPPDLVIKAIGLVSRAAGYGGMVGGQVADIQSEGKDLDFSQVEYIHTHKTGALIEASVTSGAVLAGAHENQIMSIRAYGHNIGLAFQISDDILNIEGDSKIIGKKVGTDEKKGKCTYPAVVGLTRSKEIQTGLVEAAIESLKAFDKHAEPLRQIAQYIIERKK